MKIKTWQYIVFGLMALGAIGLLALNAWMTPYDLKTEQAAARAAGLQLSKAEFARPKPPAHQDAQPDWLALVEYLNQRPMDTEALELAMGRGRGMPAEAMPEVRRLLRERADLVARVHRAAAKPHAYVEHEFDAHQLFFHYAKMREATKLLRWEGQLLAREGQYAKAVRTMELGLNMSDQLAKEPRLLGTLVSLNINSMSTSGMEDILHQAGPNARVAALVEQALRRHPIQTTLALSLKGEALFGVLTIRSLNSPDQISALTGGTSGRAMVYGSTNSRFRHALWASNEAAWLHWMTRQYQVAQLPRPKRKAAWEKVTSDIVAKSKTRSPSMIFTSKLMPAYGKADTRIIQHKARHSVTLAAADVLAHRDRTGQWPKSLLEATPKPPNDPFTGRAVGYRREPNGFVVFSAGESGTFAAKSGQPEKGQTLFRYPRPISMVAPPAPSAVGGPPMPGGHPMPGGPPLPDVPSMPGGPPMPGEAP